MKAKQLVQKLGGKLLGKKVITPAVGEVATVIWLDEWVNSLGLARI
jgi:hypothetical protein